MMITEEIKSYILETAKWAKFLSIVGFVGIGLIVIVGLVMLIVGSEMESFGNTSATGLVIVIYFIIAVLYFLPVYYLYNFAKHIRYGLRSEDQYSLTTGFENLKSHYKYVGIMMIIVLSLYVLIFLGGIVIGLYNR